MAAALLTDEPVVLYDTPRLADIENMQRLLRELGCRADWADEDLVPDLDAPGSRE